MALFAALPAVAQPLASPSTSGLRRIEVRVGGVWASGQSLGDREALLTGNSVPRGGQTTLFTTSTELSAAPALDARLGFFLGRDWRVVAGFSYARPELRTTISGDLELGAPAVATDRFDEYIVDGSIVWSPQRWRFGEGQGAPYVLGGAGYLRQLLGGRTVVETGQTFHVGGGAAWEFGRTPGARARWGFDAEIRLTWRAGGIDIDGRGRVAPRVGAGLFVRF